MSVDGDSMGKANSQICDQRYASSVGNSSLVGGIKRKKRTYRELERWDIYRGETNRKGS
jgi:hypothetical protein